MQQETISSDTQGRMVMKSAPVTTFVLAQTEFLLEFPVVALDAPAHLGDEHHLFQRGIPFAPLDQQLLLKAHLAAKIIPIAGCTRNAVKRPLSWLLAPSRQLTALQACGGNPQASAFTVTGSFPGSRRGFIGGMRSPGHPLWRPDECPPRRACPMQ